MSAKVKGGGLNGFLDAGARLEGTLTFQDAFRIDGAFKGTIVSRGELVVGDRAVVEGEIRVGRLAVSGQIQGLVYASERLEVHAGARIMAEIHAPVLVVEEGGLIQGRVDAGAGEAPEAGEAPAQA